MNKVRLSEVCSINPTVPGQVRQGAYEQVAFVPMSSLQTTGTLENVELRPYSEVEKGYKYFEIGDVLFAKITPCMENGKAGLVQNLPFQVGFGSTEFHVLRPHQKLSAQYLSLFVRQQKFRDKAAQNMTGAGGQRRVPTSFLEEVKIPLPPLDDQKRIAHLLGKVEGLIAQRKQHLQQLDALLKSVFLEMFGYYLESVGDQTLRDCIQIQQGFAFKSEEFAPSGTPIIKIGTINKGYFDYSTLSFIAGEYPEKFDRYKIKPGDLLISLTGTIGKDDYGNTCFVPPDIVFSEYFLNQRVGKLTCNSSMVIPRYIDAFLKLPRVKALLLKNDRGVRQANLSNDDIYGLKLVVPPMSLQHQYAAVVEKVEGIKIRYQQSLADLEALYGALSQKAFAGDLDLSRIELPVDEEVVSLQASNSEIPPAPLPRFVVPEIPDGAKLGDKTQRAELIGAWMEAYLRQLPSGQELSIAEIVDAVNTALQSQEDVTAWGLADQDQLKNWIFTLLESDRITQSSKTDSNDEKRHHIVLQKTR